MGSDRNSRKKKEMERLESLQKVERRFLKGMYGDFFGKRDGNADEGEPSLSFGDGDAAEQSSAFGDADAAKLAKGAKTSGSKPTGGRNASDGPKQSGGRNASDGSKPVEGRNASDGSKQAEGRNASDGSKPADSRNAAGRMEKAESRIDALAKKGEEIVSAMSSRKDALQRANDALREVQSLLDSPLYEGMPSLTGGGDDGISFSGNGGGDGGAGISGNGAGFAGKNNTAEGAGEIDPFLMAGSDGDLFSGFAGRKGQDSGRQNTAAGPEKAPLPQAVAAGGADPSAAAAGVEEAPETDPMEELESLIGLAKIKHDVKELTDFVKIQKMRKDGGLKSVPVSLHLVFTGNPGTGKTTVARILAKLYKQIGVLSKGQLVEVDRSGLVAGYVGQTALKTAQKIGEARGGVLFIDEAYALARKDDAFGQEAIDTILKAMEDSREDFIVIVAGYTGPMEVFINSNPGLKSRFNKYIEFPDYTIDELMGIFDMNCKKYDYEAADDVKAQIRAMLVQRRLAAGDNFANAREVRNLFEEIITNQARRVAAMEAPSQDDMKQLLIEDLTEIAGEDAAKVLKKAEEAAGRTREGTAAEAGDKKPAETGGRTIEGTAAEAGDKKAAETGGGTGEGTPAEAGDKKAAETGGGTGEGTAAEAGDKKSAETAGRTREGTAAEAGDKKAAETGGRTGEGTPAEAEDKTGEGTGIED